MATRLKEVDAVMVGMGWTGAILARELSKAGLSVVGIERARTASRARTSSCRRSATSCATCSDSN
jgi:choline dehydrogenase-like flavoprotein